MPDLRLEFVSDAPTLSTLRAEWNDLSARAERPSPCMTFDWFEAWWAAFGAPARPSVLAVRDSEGLRALAPMMLSWRREWGLDWRIASSCTNAHSAVGGVLVAERADECLDEMLRHFDGTQAEWDLLRFDYITKGMGLERLEERLRRRKWPYLVEQKRTGPVLDIDRPWDAFLQGLGKAFRESTLRKVRKALETGARVCIHSPAGDTDALVERAFDVAARSWSGRKGTAIMSTGQLSGFYRRLCSAAAREGWLCLAFLEQGGKDLAFELSLDYGGVRHNLKMAYDEECRSLSAGVVLRFHTLKDAFERGLRAFHFLGDREAHKDHWANRWEDHYRLTVFNRRAIPLARYFVSGPVRVRARRNPYLRRLWRLLRPSA